MTIKTTPPDHEHTATFGSINVGQVFKFHGHGTYYMKCGPVSVDGITCNRINLTTGHLVSVVDASSIVIPVTLEAREVQP